MAHRKDGIRLSKLSPLAKAVMRHSKLTINEMLEVAEHGADAGWSGFTYYKETIKFARRHRDSILAALEEDRSDFGETSLCSMLRHWKSLNGLSEAEIEASLLSRDESNDNRITMENALAWYALEKAAHEIESMK